MTKNEILKYLTEMKSEFSHRFGIETLALFGSFSRDEETNESDIDILYQLKKNAKLSLFAYAKFKTILEESLGREVDLVRSEKLKDSLRKYVQKDIIYV